MKHSCNTSFVCRAAAVFCWIALAWIPWAGAAAPEAKTAKTAPAAPAAPAAPNYKVDPRTKILFSTETTILRRGTFEDDEEAQFVEYYTKDLFPKWTAWSEFPIRVGRIDMIRDLRNKLAMAAHATDGQQVYDRLNKLTLSNMLRMSKAPYHPATRFNAMLMIGELNVPEAVPELVKTVQDGTQSDAVRVAAMVGLIRHANADLVGILDPATLQTVTGAMIAIVEKPGPDGEKADGGNWIRGQAAEVLGLLGSPGFNGAVVKALGSMASDANLPLAQRGRAAHALGQLDYSGSVVGAGPYLDALAGLARDALTFEQKGTANGRRLRSCLSDVLIGMRGSDDQHTGIAKTAADQAQRDALLKVLEPASDPKLSGDALDDAIDEALKALKGLLKAK